MEKYSVLEQRYSVGIQLCSITVRGFLLLLWPHRMHLVWQVLQQI